jgi:hypothetical protein
MNVCIHEVNLSFFCARTDNVRVSYLVAWQFDASSLSGSLRYRCIMLHTCMRPCIVHACMHVRICIFCISLKAASAAFPAHACMYSDTHVLFKHLHVPQSRLSGLSCGIFDFCTAIALLLQSPLHFFVGGGKLSYVCLCLSIYRFGVWDCVHIFLLDYQVSHYDCGASAVTLAYLRSRRRDVV